MALRTNQEGKNLRVIAPDYAYNYPCFRRVKLVAVKEQILHPDLPSIRQIERDNMLSKLSDEHCRTTTGCTRRDFQVASMNSLSKSPKQLYCMQCTEFGRRLSKHYYTPLDIQRPGLIWHRYVENPVVTTILESKGNANVNPQAPNNAYSKDAKNIKFDGLPLRYINSDLKNWR
ncbi:testis, prostate and placenta-expressed protein [Plakobranchus ocellatus]|uniref:Testis, prostate and placenta-expressed protein n=1 Tax=Plakobranchus ocellatus TaxID=259542 RepID=A0AAV3ZCS9_9GAST|nr:testis, prostate and placenta-expressed protein [Plakobranchus ocellatus]